jgi:hypothetical protein
VSQLDASHFDDRSVYAAINSLRLDDLKPHIFRTHDNGATWTEIVRGLPDGPINVVREDPVRKGLLFAGSELAVFVSFNDGDDWQPLRLNMPATSIRDLVIHDEDLVVGTHGRGFWILDDISPLREMSAAIASADAHLFAPRPTYRFPRDTNTDTPLPPEEPAGKNPPDGAILYYYLKSAAAGPMTLEVLDSSSKVVAHFSSDDKASPVNPQLNVPAYWLRPFQPLAAGAGMHRFIWDLHGSPAAVEEARRRAADLGSLHGHARERRSLDARRVVHREADGRRPELHPSRSGCGSRLLDPRAEKSLRTPDVAPATSVGAGN